MLKIITTLTLFLIGIVAKGQVVENRTVSGFSKVEVKNGIELIYTESKTPSLQIEAQDHCFLNNIMTEVKGNTLKIYLSKNGNQNEKLVKVHLSAQNLTAFEANSKAKIRVINQISADNVNIILNSESQFYGTTVSKEKTKLTANIGTVFNGRVETSSFIGNFKDNAKINLSGGTQNARFQTTDTTLLDAKNFIANTVNLNATGKSLAMIHVDKTIAVSVADEAKVSYTGFPDKIKMNEDATATPKTINYQSLTFNYYNNETQKKK